MRHHRHLILLVSAVATCSPVDAEMRNACSIAFMPTITRTAARGPSIDDNLHSPQRHLIELRIEHGDLDDLIDRLADAAPLDDLALRRLKSAGCCCAT